MNVFDKLAKVPYDTWLIVLACACIIIGVIVAYNIRTNDTDKQKGDKRLVAAVFIMGSIIFFAVAWARSYCLMGFAQTVYDSTGYDLRYDLVKKSRAREAGLDL